MRTVRALIFLVVLAVPLHAQEVSHGEVKAKRSCAGEGCGLTTLEGCTFRAGDVTPEFFICDSTGKVLDVSGGVVFLPAGGRISIGEPTPLDPLHVVGTVRVSSSTGAIQRFNRDDSSIANNNTIGAIRFQGDDPTAGLPGAQILAISRGTWVTDFRPTALRFSTDEAGTLATRLTINDDGGIGIVTTNPSSPLDLDVGTGVGTAELDGSLGGCLAIRDTDDSGWTCSTTLNGTRTDFCCLTPATCADDC